MGKRSKRELKPYEIDHDVIDLAKYIEHSSNFDWESEELLFEFILEDDEDEIHHLDPISDSDLIFSLLLDDFDDGSLRDD